MIHGLDITEQEYFDTKTLLGEQWRFIEDYPDYEISSYGRVKSHKKSTIKILSPGIDNGGYPHVSLGNEEGRKNKLVHRLVALTFIHNEDTDVNNVVNHIDGDRDNPAWTNLEWTTQSNNISIKDKNGLSALDKTHERSKKRIKATAKTFPHKELIFNSEKEAGQYLDANPSKICMALKRENKSGKPASSLGYYWEYLD